MSEESLGLQVDYVKQTITLYGIPYSFQFFKFLGVDGKDGEYFRFNKQIEGGAVSVSRYLTNEAAYEAAEKERANP